MEIERVKRLVALGNYQMSGHAEEEREAETISLEDIKSAIRNGELLEDYPDDPRGASCLLLGNSTDDGLTRAHGRRKERGDRHEHAKLWRVFVLQRHGH